MSINNSQAGNSPSELSFNENNENQSNIDQLLSVDIVTTGQPSLSSSIQLNPTDMIVANIQQHNNVPMRQHARPEEQHHHHHHQQQQQQQQVFQQTQQQQNRQEQQRRLQQQQQHLQQELRRVQQQQQSLRQQTQREQQRRQREREQQRFQQWLESQNLTYEQWVERENQERAQRGALQNQERVQRSQQRYDREEERYREEQEEWEREQYLLRRSPGFNEILDEILQERELDEYQLERMTPQERQAIREQEQLNEIEGNPASRPSGIPSDGFERYATFKRAQLHHDELEQTINIDEMEKWDRLEQHNGNEEQLIQKQQWEEIEFLHQQLQQPIHY